MAQSKHVDGAKHAGPKGGRATRLILIAGFLAVGLLVGLLLDGIFRGGNPSSSKPVAAVTPGARGAGERFYPTATETKRPPATQPRYVPPWLATPEDSKDAPPNHIPAWKMGSGPPEQKAPPKLPPLPPDPRNFDPSKLPEKGIDGDRPPRPVPGLE